MIGKTNSQVGGSSKVEKVNILLTSNQLEQSALIGATISVSYGDNATQYVWDGTSLVVDIPEYATYTVSVSDVTGYKTPESITAIAVKDNARTLTFTYQAEKVKVSVSASDGRSMSGTKITINGVEKTFSGKSIEAFIPFGTEYSIVAGDVDGLAKPSKKTYTASQSLREIDLVYTTCALVVNILSNQQNDDALAAVKATVTYGSTTKEVSNGEVVDIPLNTFITITFPNVEDYATPKPITFTSIAGMNERTGTYLTEKVVVNVYSNDGNSMDGQIVTLRNDLRNGVYIQDTLGRCWEGSFWDGSATPNGIAVVTDDLSFVVALNDLPNKMKMAETGGTKSPSNAKSTTDGKANTQVLKSAYGSSTSYLIGAITAFSFPNGNKGYLWANDQLYLAVMTLREEINNLLLIAGGTALGTNYPSSTYGYSEAAYSDYFGGTYDRNSDGVPEWDSEDNYASDFETYARPITDFVFNPFFEDKIKNVVNSKAEFKIHPWYNYTVSVNDKQGYKTPATKNFTAQLTVNNVVMEYVKVVNKRTVIRIDQTITDPEAMITRIVDEGGIEAIRANSHRYTGTFADGKMTLKQLDDADGTKYADGTTATLTTIGTDVWMKLPQFHWKCSQYATDVWDFEVVYGAKPDDTYKTWDGNDLIGAYEAYNSSNKSYSVSGKDSTGNVQQDKFKTYAQARGEGFSLVKWKHHCMMAMLYYTMYGNTNCQAKIGKGTESKTKVTGATNSLGMTDTVAGGNGDSNSINFWGLENWWGNKDEWVDNVAIDARVWKVTEDDGTVRQAGTGGSSNGWISKLLLGENIDLIPTAASGSETTGYCDYYAQSSANTRVFVRSSYAANTHGGVACATATQAYLMSSDFRGSRLAFRGNIVIE